jgi:uncharacterized protein (DUF2252 family)
MAANRQDSGPPAKIVHLAEAERIERGKAARKAVPRASHAAWDPPADRPSPIDLLLGQETTRVPDLLPLRHERMLQSPFTFYRGAAVVMASDLATVPNSGLKVQCCGDAHLSNFGGFASPERTLVFDTNDFDETNPGPFEWDVKRLAASFEIAARSREFAPKIARTIVLECVRGYRSAMAQFTGMSNLDVWYAHLDVQRIIDESRQQLTAAELKRIDKTMAKAESRDNLRAFDKLVQRVNGQFRIVSDPPIVVPLDDLFGAEEGAPIREWLADHLRRYRRSLQPDRRHLLEGYRLVDFARKVVGVGSVGTRCWIALMMGRDDSDPLFLQIKEAEASVLERYSGSSQYSNHGQRVVEGQRLLQASSDIMLGWLRATGVDNVDRDYYVRQLWDWKVSANIEAQSPEAMKTYAQMCGWTLARGHARSGDRIAIAAYLGSGEVFDNALADFATAYADQNERDYQVMVEAAATGRLDPVTTVSPR